MTSEPSKNIWIRRQQCPCGDWKCYVACDGDDEDSSLASRLNKTRTIHLPNLWNFARKNGFSIRTERLRLRPRLGVCKQDFYRSGFAPARKKQTDDQVWLLLAYRKIHEADQERILLMSKAGFPIHCIVKVLELEKGIQGGHLPFLERDVRNFVQNWKKLVQENDALQTEKRENDMMELLEACRAMKEADQNFVYNFTVDEDDKVENIAWSYGDSIHAFNMFSDVVYFDTSCRSITYGIVYGVWLGIDNYGRIIFFGCVFLQGEMPILSLGLDRLVRFIKGRCPQTILTDLDPGLQEAIRSELPNTRHHVDEFGLWWNQMVSQFGLNSNGHIALLSSLCASWSASYTGGYFLARISTVAFLKSVDAFLKGIFSAQTCLRSFFEQVGIYELVLSLQYAISEMANGILCRCALRVLVVKNYFQLPERYFPIPWRRESSLVPYNDQCTQYGTDEWFHEFHSPTETHFAESSMRKEHSEFVQTELRKELTRLLNEVRNVPPGDGVGTDLALSSTG
ncbi:hypothetical protein RJ641_032999 [Dillenia turbinata]|uniref:Protein FAR1-RELATED SEQUENCE n=1 Tax=Dillenia turbinata TaxID=194707 RepID=A0AAN8ZCY0_9MAGN